MMTTSENTELTLPDFDLGTQAQLNAANSIRSRYLFKLIDAGFELENIQNFVTVRCIAKWWLDSRDDLTVPRFTNYLASIRRLITKHGSVDAAAHAVQNAEKKRLEQSANYRKLSQPMYKYKG